MQKLWLFYHAVRETETYSGSDCGRGGKRVRDEEADNGLVLKVRDAEALAVDVHELHLKIRNLILVYSFTRKPQSPLRATESNNAGGGDKRLITYWDGEYQQGREGRGSDGGYHRQ